MTKVKGIRGNKCQSIILIVTYMRCKYESNKKRGGRKNVNLRFKIEKKRYFTDKLSRVIGVNITKYEQSQV